MHYTILDCYTDEASGLGVPPYLGTYPRYLFGKLINEGHTVSYLTIDDLRLFLKYDGIKIDFSKQQKTNINVYNLTKNDTQKTLAKTDTLLVILGVHVPGKYLSALPGTLKELISHLKKLKSSNKKNSNLKFNKILTKNLKKMKIVLTGPALFGTQLEGGKFSEQLNSKAVSDLVNEIKAYPFSFPKIREFSNISAQILDQIPDKRVIEIETGRGCKVGKCSFCTEPIKSKFINRPNKDILGEVIAYYNAGARFFRLGKQADFYASEDPISLLKNINKHCPDIEVLHIDNVNPNSVITPKGIEITKAVVKYCTEGNIAAFGVESFDPKVVKANLLNTSPKIALKAIEIINKYGATRGPNGMHKFLPGINIIFGLLKENKESHKLNMQALKYCLDNNLLLRRINVRQVAVLPGTYLKEHGGDKFLKKNKALYWKWRNQIRQEIDNQMLKRILPVGTIIKDVYTEIYDGNTTFCRHMGSYPLTIGVKGRLPLNKKIDVKVTGHMLRSITAEPINK